MRITTESFYLPQDYAKRIKALRERFGLSQQQLAGLLAVSLPLVKQWEQGRSRPPIQYWEQIVLVILSIGFANSPKLCFSSLVNKRCISLLSTKAGAAVVWELARASRLTD